METKKRKRRTPTIAVVLGDPAGIGPEVAVKALAAAPVRRLASFVIIADGRTLEAAIKVAGVDIEVTPLKGVEDLGREAGPGIHLLDQGNLSPGDYAPGVVSEACGRAMGEDLKAASMLCRQGLARALVYAPLTKAALHAAGVTSSSELEYFARLAGAGEGDVSEIGKAGRLWLARATSHIPLREVAGQLDRQRVLWAIRLLHRVMDSYGRKSRTILVSALNPHGGEGGLFGDEEREIAAAVGAADIEGIPVSGPHPADTVFLRFKRGEGDGVVAMYHDQGQIGAKLLGFGRGVTIGAGLPFITVTPTHGSGHDLAGAGRARPEAMAEAIKVAVRLAGKRG